MESDTECNKLIIYLHRCRQIFSEICCGPNSLTGYRNKRKLCDQGRFELIKLINCLKSKLGEPSSYANDDERKLYCLHFEMNLKQRKFKNLRDEYYLQQKQLEDSQRILKTKQRQLEMYTEYYFSHGFTCTKIITTYFTSTEVKQIVTSKEFRNFIKLIILWLDHFISSYSVIFRPKTTDTEYKLMKLICIMCTNISDHICDIISHFEDVFRSLLEVVCNGVHHICDETIKMPLVNFLYNISRSNYILNQKDIEKILLTSGYCLCNCDANVCMSILKVLLVLAQSDKYGKLIANNLGSMIPEMPLRMLANSPNADIKNMATSIVQLLNDVRTHEFCETPSTSEDNTSNKPATSCSSEVSFNDSSESNVNSGDSVEPRMQKYVQKSGCNTVVTEHSVGHHKMESVKMWKTVVSYTDGCQSKLIRYKKNL